MSKRTTLLFESDVELRKAQRDYQAVDSPDNHLKLLTALQRSAPDQFDGEMRRLGAAFDAAHDNLRTVERERGQYHDSEAGRRQYSPMTRPHRRQLQRAEEHLRNHEDAVRRWNDAAGYLTQAAEQHSVNPGLYVPATTRSNGVADAHQTMSKLKMLYRGARTAPVVGRHFGHLSRSAPISTQDYVTAHPSQPDEWMAGFGEEQHARQFGQAVEAVLPQYRLNFVMRHPGGNFVAHIDPRPPAPAAESLDRSPLRFESDAALRGAERAMRAEPNDAHALERYRNELRRTGGLEAFDHARTTQIMSPHIEQFMNANHKHLFSAGQPERREQAMRDARQAMHTALMMRQMELGKTGTYSPRDVLEHFPEARNKTNHRSTRNHVVSMINAVAHPDHEDFTRHPAHNMAAIVDHIKRHDPKAILHVAWVPSDSGETPGLTHRRFVGVEFNQYGSDGSIRHTAEPGHGIRYAWNTGLDGQHLLGRRPATAQARAV